MKKTKDELEFIKKLLQNPRDWLNREIKKRSGELQIVKQIPQHPRDRIK